MEATPVRADLWIDCLSMSWDDYLRLLRDSSSEARSPEAYQRLRLLGVPAGVLWIAGYPSGPVAARQGTLP